MAEKEKKAEPAATAPATPSANTGGKKEAAAPSGGLMSKTPVVLGGVMLIEAAVLFAGFKFLGGSGPQQAAAEIKSSEGHGGSSAAGHDGQAAPATDKNRAIEISVVDFRAPNKRSGRTFIYDVSIFVVTKGEFEKQVKGIIKDREALIKDRIRTIIADSDPEKLGGGSEAGLETFRRQVKHQLEDIVGEGMIEEVLVPRCIPFRTDF